MKKILTFLVMLVASVSFLMAQAPQAKFNYQAVVRDRNNHDNLVMNRTINVTIEILNGDNTLPIETREVTTNRNGMVSFVIGPVAPTTADNTPIDIDWSNATIKATFKEGNTVLSEVLNPIMPVPLALQAAEDPMTITTDKIVEYLSNQNTTGEDVGRIVNALTSNPNVKNAVRDSIISYIKTQPAKVKELAIYFLGTVTVDEAKDAYDTLDAAVKQKIKQILVDSIKANRALAYQIVADYLSKTTTTEVNQLWLAARENPQFHQIFDAVRDSAITYVMNHPQYMMTIAQYYIKNVLKYQDVQTIYQTLRDQNHDLYVALQNKFNDYLESYLGNNYVQACGDVTVCDLKNDLDNAKAKAAQCPYFVQATATTNTDQFTFQAIINNVPSTNLPTLTVVKPGTTSDFTCYPTPYNSWNTESSTNGVTYTGQPSAGLYDGALNAGDKVVFKLVGQGNCPTLTKEVTITVQ